MRTAILIDGGFFLTRLQSLQGAAPPIAVARTLHAMCLKHLRRQRRSKQHLYRIFYYDCPPLTKKVHHPINRRAIDFGKSSTAVWRTEFFEELKKLRKVALRLGYLNDRSGQWVLKPQAFKDLIAGKRSVADLIEADIRYDVRQKGVDMRIGIDIASMAFKRQVDQIVLVAGDSDFVPAAKLARREGIDFILDPMWASISADLQEHIDGLTSVIPKPVPKSPETPSD